jgi:hypothetical protein
MKERIYLLETNVEEQNRSAYNPNSTYPLGLAYLDSTLTNEGYEVYTKDYADLTTEACLKEIENTIQSFNPKIVGISVMSMTRATTYEAIKLIKRINPNIKILLGGIHASVMYKQLVENFPIDAVVIGEGEETVKELVPALIHNNPLDIIKGIAFKRNESVIVTPTRDLICDLDKIPFPNHAAFMNNDRTSVCMLSSRGCPNMCLTGDTIVNTLDGDIPIKDLVGKKDIKVFTFDKETEQVFITDAINCQKTKSNTNIVRVLFDDGTHIDCTPDHKFLVFKNGNQFIDIER